MTSDLREKKSFLEKLKEYKMKKWLKGDLSSSERAELDYIIGEMEQALKKKFLPGIGEVDKLLINHLKNYKRERIGSSLQGSNKLYRNKIEHDLRTECLNDLEVLNKIDSEVHLLYEDWTPEEKACLLDTVHSLKQLGEGEYRVKVSTIVNSRETKDAVDYVYKILSEKKGTGVSKEVIEKVIKKIFL